MKTTFSKEEDNAIVHEVYVTKSFCALKKDNQLYTEVASTLNGKDLRKREVTSKSVSDRFSRLVANQHKSDKYKCGLSGVNEDYSKENKLLYSMVAAIDDIDEECAVVSQAGKLKKKKQKTLDNNVKECVMNRRSNKRSRAEVEKDQVEAVLSSKTSVMEDQSDLSSTNKPTPKNTQER